MKRPDLITVLCILTFIGSAWGIYSGINSYLAADVAAGATQEVLEQAQETIESEANNQEEADMANKILNSVTNSLTPDKIKKNGLAGAISSVLCIIGAILMWSMQKKGYFIYVAGVLISVVAPIIINSGFMGMAASGFSLFIGVIFCVLYGLKLKEMV
jgi:hypothetical protein